MKLRTRDDYYLSSTYIYLMELQCGCASSRLRQCCASPISVVAESLLGSSSHGTITLFRITILRVLCGTLVITISEILTNHSK